MPPRIPDRQREQILADIQAATKSQRQIARDHGVSTTAVRKIGKAAGLNHWSRERTEKATRAKAVDHQAKLVELAAQSARIAGKIGDSLEAIEDWSKVSPYTRGLLFGIASDKAKDLASTETGVEQAITGLGKLFDGLIEQHGDGSDD